MSGENNGRGSAGVRPNSKKRTCMRHMGGKNEGTDGPAGKNLLVEGYGPGDGNKGIFPGCESCNGRLEIHWKRHPARRRGTGGGERRRVRDGRRCAGTAAHSSRRRRSFLDLPLYLSAGPRQMFSGRGGLGLADEDHPTSRRLLEVHGQATSPSHNRVSPVTLSLAGREVIR